MNEIKLKKILENLLFEIENNSHLSIEEIINQLSLDIETNLLLKEMN